MQGYRLAMARAIDPSTAAIFRTLSRIRGRRIFHPHGIGFAATLRPLGGARTGARLFDDSSSHRAVVRLSRSVGLPEYLADPCGLGITIPDAYGHDRAQDFLLVSSAAPPGARHLVLPARAFGDRPYSSLLPYRVDNALRLVGAVATVAAPGPTLAALSERNHGGMTFKILLAPIRGKWRPVADLELEERIADREAEDLRLDPQNTGGGLEPAGLLNRLRRPAYRGSQEGRRAPGTAQPASEREPEPTRRGRQPASTAGEPPR